MIKDHDKLLEVYYNVYRREEEEKVLMNTKLVIGSYKDVPPINFKCIAIKTTKGDTGNTLVLIQPISHS